MTNAGRPMRRIALVGLGAAARTIHLPAYSGIPGLEVVGGCDPAARNGAFRFPLFPSVEAILEKVRPDILAVLTPPDTHYELTCTGLRAGCHVFCEKPFTKTLDEAREIVAQSRKLGRWVVVNNQYRFMNMHAAAKRLIGTPKFGELLFVEAHQSFFTSESTEAGWRGRLKERTCREFGTHVFDLCRFFFSEDPRAITARMPRPLRPDEADYLNLIRLDFSGDRAAHVTLDRLCRGPHRYLTLRLDGSAGFIETRLGGGIEVATGIRGGTRRPFLEWDVSLGGRARLYHGERHRKIASDPKDVFAHATRRLMQAFLDAIDSGGAPPCHAEDNCRTLALMLAAYESDAKKATIEMSY